MQVSCLPRFKAGTHEATNRCNKSLQQIALHVQSRDKSYALVAVKGCCDKSPGVNANTISRWLIIIFRHDTGDKKFYEMFLFTMKFVAQRVAVIYRLVCFGHCRPWTIRSKSS